jgi:outer membrane protein assembly factor BamD (BamD/ComL family)
MKFYENVKHAVLLFFSLLLIIKLNAQEKEYKEINNLINSISGEKTLDSQKGIKLYSMSNDFIHSYPTSPLGYYAKSQYYVFSGINVDSAYFIFKKSSDLLFPLDEKTKSIYCKKFNLCEESFKAYLDTLSFASLRHYSKNQSISQVKTFLDKYPNSSIAYSQGKELYEKLRYEELSYSNKIKLHEDFLIEFPDSKHRKEISEKVEQLVYSEISYSNDTTDYLNYIKKYPKSQFVSEAQLKVVSIKEAIIDKEFLHCSDDSRCLIQFLKNHPEAKQAEQAVKKIIQNASTVFSIGHHPVAINHLKALNALNLPLGKLYNVDSLLYSFEFNSCKTFNEVENWNKYLASYPNSPLYSQALNHRDSLEFRHIVYSSKHLTSAKYKIILEDFIKSYPTSIYLNDAKQELKKIGQSQSERNIAEQLYLQKYALHNGKVLRLFVCENLKYSDRNLILPDKRSLKGSFENDSRGKGVFEIEIGDVGNLWSDRRRNEGVEYYLNFRNDTITKLKTKILQDYGVSLEEFPFKNTSDLELEETLALSNSENLFIRNYVTTSISKTDANGICYVSGFFVNEKHYQKDLDCFVAKINCNETDLGKKVIWLKEFTELEVDGVNLNDWVIELKIEGSQLYVCSLNDKKEYSVYKFSMVGNLEWKKKISEINSNLATINILSNGDLIFFGHSLYAYDNMGFAILSSQNGSFIKVIKKIANEPHGYFGAMVTMNNEFIVAINYLEYGVGGDKQKSIGRAISTNSAVGLNLPNTMLLKYNNKGEITGQKIFKTVEPRVISVGTYKNGRVLLKGERGKQDYSDKNFISSFFLEMDENLNVISTDGLD